MSRRIRLGLLTLWLGMTGGGLALLAAYSNAPGAAPPPVLSWPTGGSLQFSKHGATLVMFVHPRCPCTRASLGELEKIVARYPGSVTPWVVFLKPSEFADDWERTDLWKTAAAIPGVRVISDPDGTEAHRFHAATSGQTLLYSDRGALLFDGGITFARGHAGDNSGRTAIELNLSGRSPGYCHTPVFGCPLTAPPSDE